MMKYHLRSLVVLILSGAGILTAGAEQQAVNYVEKLEPGVTLTPIHDDEAKFEQPVWCSPVPGSPDMFVILEHQTGKAWILHPAKDGYRRKTLFANWGDAVSDGPWEGLMCIAFHPEFVQNRRFFVKHEMLIKEQRHTVIVEKRAHPELPEDSGSVSEVLLAIEQPADNHNGGTLAFGPDGYLYIGMGDGGPQEDPNGFTQSGQSLLGKMLRLDVDTLSPDRAYGIPAGNPFLHADPQFWRPEIWALGLREPWRFSFDRRTGDLWVGDVGQVRYEEILILRKGENHGWNVREGWESFKPTHQRAGERYASPLLAYGRRLGASVTGGYVYRGKTYPGWNGVYVFADFNTRRLFGLRSNGNQIDSLLEIGMAPDAPASFGEGEDGELYLVGYGGTIYQLEFPETAFPQGRPLAAKTWQDQRAQVRQAAESVMGPFPGEERRIALEVRVLQEVDMGSYVRRLITYQSEPESRTPAYLCLPKRALNEGAPAPGVLCLHPTDMHVGHQVVVGLGGRPGRQYAAELAERGFVTIAPAYPLLANYWPNLSALHYVSGTMKAIWDNSRALDLLESLPAVSADDGFAAIGHSLGGHNAIYTALFDDRIQAVVSSCGFDAFPDYYGGDRANWMFGKGWCQLRYMPRLSNYRDRLDEIPFDFHDLLGSLAPRRLFVNAPLHDDNFRWQSVERIMLSAKEAYARFQAEEQITVRHPDTGHDFPQTMREQAYQTIQSVLGKP